jgi:carbon storage regulator
MLVLTRKPNEKIRIGDDIVITVLRTKGKGVRLGIEAPAHIQVLRGELAFKLPAEKPEEPEPEITSAHIAGEPAPCQVVQASGHRQRPATAWPTSPGNRTGATEPGASRQPDTSRDERPLHSPVKAQIG